MPRFQLVTFNREAQRGLWINGSREYTPSGYWRRLTGSHAIRDRELRSRDGTVADATVAAAHSLSRFNDVRFQAGGTTLFRAGVSISTGLDGTPLDMVVSEPRTGTDAEYLFHCGGGRLEKVDSTGVVTQWGIDPPSGGNWGVDPGGTGEDDSEVVVTGPQERTIGDTTSVTGSTGTWFGAPTAVFVDTTDVLSPSGSAICQVLVDEVIENEGETF